MPEFDIKKDPTKVFIAGTGSGCELMPRKTDYTVYCLNDYIKVERYGIRPDLLFIMDVLDEKPQIVSGFDNLGEVIERINRLGVPLIAPLKYADIPLSQAFPLEECVKQFGLPYFSNTISYMIAYALMQNVKEIRLFGINQASSSEYFYEKAGVEYWIGVAVGRGVEVVINGEMSELLTNKRRFGGNILYGYNSSYEAIVRDEKRFGKAVIKQLLLPPINVSRTIRKVTSS